MAVQFGDRTFTWLFRSEVTLSRGCSKVEVTPSQDVQAECDTFTPLIRLGEISSSMVVQVGCDTFTQLFTQHPEVLEYLADYDTMVVEGINVGEALRYFNADFMNNLKWKLFSR
jgi:hypothetical protein